MDESATGSVNLFSGEFPTARRVVHSGRIRAVSEEDRAVSVVDLPQREIARFRSEQVFSLSVVQ
jgi:hypothetical protein